MNKTARHTGSGLGSSLVMTALVATACAAVLPACRGDRTDAPPRRFFPDMDYQPKWKAQSQSDFFEDGRTQRQPDEQAVAWGRFSYDPLTAGNADWAKGFADERADMLREDPGFYRGVDADGDYLDTMPVTPTREMILHGQERFNIYCSACHGYLGNGQGTVGVKWSYLPADISGNEIYRDRAQRTGKDGYLFHVIREGVWAPDGANRMPGYAHAVDARDAWAIVSYLRTLQAARNATLDDLSRRDRERLESQLGAATPAEGDQPADPGAAQDASQGSESVTDPNTEAVSGSDEPSNDEGAATGEGGES